MFTLPSTMIGVFKFNIDYISDHAVDADKRRYASRHEAVRHYIDLDHLGEPPFDMVPRRWTDMLTAYFNLSCIRPEGDTVLLHQAYADGGDLSVIPVRARQFVIRHVLPQYYEDIWVFDRDTVKAYWPHLDCGGCRAVTGFEEFTQHGILPYHLVEMQNRLTRAFAVKDLPRVLRFATDIGHYIGDAHVPLHTTKNYNGQLTGQLGIHAFWETRIPELIAESTFDFLVGPARYIDDPEAYYWNIVLQSFRLSGDVLRIEKELSKEYPADRQYCFDERLNMVVRTQCADYAIAYHERMNGMVEERMRDAILAIGSAWYTAWVDGGQPAFSDFMLELSDADRKAYEALEREFVRGRTFGRPHDDQ